MGQIFKTSVMILLAAVLSACQTVGDRRKHDHHAYSPPEDKSIDQVISSAEEENQTPENQILEIPESFQLSMGKPIQQWMDYFTGRGRKWFQRALDRGAPIMSTMQERLTRAGLPADMVYLSMIESGFNNHARSRSRAVGAWQFMKSTGKNYGLKITPWIDERRDPIKATHAAIKYLSDLRDMFDDWYLAMMAYNAGEGKIARAINRYRTRDPEKLLKHSYLKRETRNYVPKFIAAMTIAKDPEKYGFEKPRATPYTYATVMAKKPVSLKTLANHLDVSYNDLRDLNAELITNITPPNTEYPLKVPHELKEKTESAITLAYAKIPTTPYGTHKVHRGDTLSRIARRYGTTVSTLKQVNASLTHTHLLQIGQNLVVPVTPQYASQYTSESVDRVIAAAEDSRVHTSITVASAAQGRTVHTVSRGENLWSISKKYGTSVRLIKKVNAMARSRIYPGQRLLIPEA